MIPPLSLRAAWRWVADQLHHLGHVKEFRGEADQLHHVAHVQEFRREADQLHRVAHVQEFRGEADQLHHVAHVEEFRGEADQLHHNPVEDGGEAHQPSEPTRYYSDTFHQPCSTPRGTI